MDMERKKKVLNLRVTERQRSTYERAATLEGVSVSSLVAKAADERAQQVLHEHASMTIPSDLFDSLLTSLDNPAPLAPSLEKAFSEPLFTNG